MCGIAGIYHYSNPGKPVSQQQVEKMLTVIRHRGPDESGIYLRKNIGIGNVRLSIIDLASGQQPISAENERYWIVYNGELFNYIELRRKLEKRGCNFQTDTDTEVVLQAYANYGTNCLQKFNGQFAIAIWDKQKHELFLARDRVGIRPLFYTYVNGSFYFCSEIKGLFSQPEIYRSLSDKGLSQIFRFWTTITPNTPYEGIYELSAGHYMLVNPNGMSIKKYWSYSYPEKQENYLTFDKIEATEAFEELFEDAVRIRLRADVEVAAYLSGGIDSSVTTAFIKKIEPNVLNTFSIGFADSVFDESKYQMEAAAYFNTNHTAFSCTSGEIGNHFINTVYATEYPILRTAPTPMYLLSEKVREKNIKVVITGEGADEMLAGYNIFKEAKIRRFWAQQPDSKIRPLLLKKLYPYLPLFKQASNLSLKYFFGFKLNEINNPYYSHLLRWSNTRRIQNYLSEEIKHRIKTYDPFIDLDANMETGFQNWSDLAKSQYLESSIFMTGYLLSSQGDRMAMANSVEGRYPFLDHRLIEFVSKLPDNLKLNGLNEKFLLKEMMKGRIPESILSRSKQAYRAPVNSSFFGENSPDYVEDILSSDKIHEFGIFNYDFVARLIKKVKSPDPLSEIDDMAIAGILSTQLVYQMFIKGNVPWTIPAELENLKIIND